MESEKIRQFLIYTDDRNGLKQKAEFTKKVQEFNELRFLLFG